MTAEDNSLLEFTCCLFNTDYIVRCALREKEVKDEAYHLVRKAKEAGMTRELLNRLLDGAWNETGKTAVSEAAQESKKETMQQAASELGVGGEADD